LHEEASNVRQMKESNINNQNGSSDRLVGCQLVLTHFNIMYFWMFLCSITWDLRSYVSSWYYNIFLIEQYILE